MISTAAAVAFRGRSGPRVGDSQRVSQAALQAELVRGAMVRNSQSISPMPDPLPPAPLLGLVSMAAIAVVAVIGELFKRFAQLWGSNNDRPKRTAIYEQYGLYRVEVNRSGYPDGAFELYALPSTKFSAGSSYPQWRMYDSDFSPFGRVSWPGSVAFTNTTNTGAGGWVLRLEIVTPSLNAVGPAFQVFITAPGGETKMAPAISYSFFNSSNQVTPSATWNPNTETGITVDPVSYVPQTAGTPLDRLPPVPAAASVAQEAPLQQAQSPAAEGAPVVPVVTASPALVATAQVTRSNFYVPSRLPAPLKPPATATRSTTGAGTLVAPAALPIKQTSTDQRQYGSQTITSIGVRPDVVAIAEEVGRMEQKLGRLLGGMDTTPDWLDGALGPLLNQLKDAILDALVVDVPATTYEFEAPCDKDTNGDPVVLASEIEALDYQPAIVARLDAIAEAMGVLKGWKQPTCRVNPPQSNVTVTAYEYDPEA